MKSICFGLETCSPQKICHHDDDNGQKHTLHLWAHNFVFHNFEIHCFVLIFSQLLLSIWACLQLHIPLKGVTITVLHDLMLRSSKIDWVVNPDQSLLMISPDHNDSLEILSIILNWKKERWMLYPFRQKVVRTFTNLPMYHVTWNTKTWWFFCEI